MNTHAIVSLDTRYKKKNGTFNICIQLVRGGENGSQMIPTGFSVPIGDWDLKRRKVKDSYEGVSSVPKLNRQIDDKKEEANDILIELEEQELLNSMSLTEVKNKITQDNKGGSFFAYADELLIDLAKAERFGTRDAYSSAMKALENFYGSRKLSFQKITYDFLTKFETDHFSHGNMVNGLAAYMRSIRAIYNKAIKSGVVDEKYYPFKKYTIKTERTRKKAMVEPALKKIISHKLDESHPLFHTRNFCVASYMMWGMNYTDMAYLEKKHLVDGRIHYRRSKTSKLYDIKMAPALQEIISYYVNLSPDSDYVFPILKGDNSERHYLDIKWARKRYNGKLKQLAEECEIREGIPVEMSSYVIRHTFATHAALLDIPLLAISSMLGHSSLKTTQIYLQELPTNKLDEYNDKIMSGK